jgi:NB-ARC domain/TIR domain
MIKVFVSYAWAGDVEFAQRLADRLEREPGLSVQFDQYDVTGGTELTHFMEQSMHSDRIVSVCEPAYKQRADDRVRGVGYEAKLGSAQILARNPRGKFIPVLRGEDDLTSIPDYLTGLAFIDMRAPRDFESGVLELLATLHDKPSRTRPPKNAESTVAEAAHGTAPRRPPLFIGRDDNVAVLRGRLLDPAVTSTVVRGWPGVGKSTIVAALAHDRQVLARFPTILWTSIGEYPDTTKGLRTWLRYLEPDNAAAEAPVTELTTRLARILSTRRALLLIDDVWQEEHASPFRAGGAQCHTVLTTRGVALAQRLAGGASDVYLLPVLAPEPSLDLLACIAPSVVARHRDAARELVDELEGLPLAIRVAGHLLAAEEARGLSAEVLLAELREGRQLLDAAAPDPGLAEFVPATVTALLRRTTDRLTPDERIRFAQLGPFMPKPATIPLDVLETMWDVADARPTVRALVDHGLLEAAGEGVFQMHALLERHANELLEEL